jgi:hypothetical protein
MNSYPDLYVSSAEHLTAGHLTADQIDDQLIGDLAAAPAEHLAACSLCSDRVATAASPLADFQNVTTAWSERHSATLPIPVPVQQRPLWQRHMAWATASLSLAFGIALINSSHQFSLQTTASQPAPIQTAQSFATPQTIAPQTIPAQPPALTETASIATAPRATQIAADNHMLRAIDASFDSSSDSPAALGLIPAAAPSAGPPASIQD